MDSALRTGTRLRALLVRLAVTAGLMVAAWLISSLMAGSASASTSSGHAETDATSSSDSGLLGGLLGGVVDGLTQTVDNIVGGPANASDHGTEADVPHGSDAGTGESSDDAVLPDLLPGSSSSSGTSSTGTASTRPTEPLEQETSESASVQNESHAAVMTGTATTRQAHADRSHRAVPKRTTGSTADRPMTKLSTADTDNGRRANPSLPVGPPTPQAPPAPSTSISAGHDSTTHGKSWFLTAVGDATLTPPTAAGTAIDHRTTAVDRNRDRPATAPD